MIFCPANCLGFSCANIIWVQILNNFPFFGPQFANQQLELSIKEKEEIAAKLSQSERILAEGKRSMQKLEEDNSRLRRALEQSMTTLNRMSLDSDNYVDRYSMKSFSTVFIKIWRFLAILNLFLLIHNLQN